MTYEVPSMSKHSAGVKEDGALDSPLQVSHSVALSLTAPPPPGTPVETGTSQPGGKVSL